MTTLPPSSANRPAVAPDRAAPSPLPPETTKAPAESNWENEGGALKTPSPAPRKNRIRGAFGSWGNLPPSRRGWWVLAALTSALVIWFLSPDAAMFATLLVGLIMIVLLMLIVGGKDKSGV